MVSCLIYGYAIAGGYNWWSHEVTLTKVYVVGKDEFEIDVDNSWGKSWGDEGHGRLTQSKATADEQICTRVCVVNE